MKKNSQPVKSTSQSNSLYFQLSTAFSNYNNSHFKSEFSNNYKFSDLLKKLLSYLRFSNRQGPELDFFFKTYIGAKKPVIKSNEVDSLKIKLLAKKMLNNIILKNKTRFILNNKLPVILEKSMGYAKHQSYVANSKVNLLNKILPKNIYSFKFKEWLKRYYAYWQFKEYSRGQLFDHIFHMPICKYQPRASNGLHPRRIINTRVPIGDYLNNKGLYKKWKFSTKRKDIYINLSPLSSRSYGDIDELLSFREFTAKKWITLVFKMGHFVNQPVDYYDQIFGMSNISFNTNNNVHGLKDALRAFMVLSNQVRPGAKINIINAQEAFAYLEKLKLKQEFNIETAYLNNLNNHPDKSWLQAHFEYGPRGLSYNTKYLINKQPYELLNKLAFIRSFYLTEINEKTSLYWKNAVPRWNKCSEAGVAVKRFKPVWDYILNSYTSLNPYGWMPQELFNNANDMWFPDVKDDYRFLDRKYSTPPYGLRYAIRGWAKARSWVYKDLNAIDTDFYNETRKHFYYFISEIPYFRNWDLAKPLANEVIYFTGPMESNASVRFLMEACKEYNEFNKIKVLNFLNKPSDIDGIFCRALNTEMIPRWYSYLYMNLKYLHTKKFSPRTDLEKFKFFISQLYKLGVHLGPKNKYPDKKRLHSAYILNMVNEYFSFGLYNERQLMDCKDNYSFIIRGAETNDYKSRLLNKILHNDMIAAYGEEYYTPLFSYIFKDRKRYIKDLKKKKNPMGTKESFIFGWIDFNFDNYRSYVYDIYAVNEVRKTLLKKK